MTTSRFITAVLFAGVMSAVTPATALAGTNTTAKHELRFDWLESSQIKTATDDDEQTVLEDGRNATTGGTAAGEYGFNGILTRSTIDSGPTGAVELKVLSSYSFDVDGINPSNTWFGIDATTENNAFHSEDLRMTNAPAGNEFRATFYWHISGKFLLDIAKPANADPIFGAEATMEFAYEAGAPRWNGGVAVDRLSFPFSMTGILDGGDRKFTGVVDERVEVDLRTNGSVALAHVVDLDVRTFFLNDGPSLNFDLEGLALHDFSSTASLVGVLFRDLDGNVLSGIGIESPEGFNYPILNAVPQPVPVPASLPLLGVALAGLLASAQWRRKSACRTPGRRLTWKRPTPCRPAAPPHSRIRSARCHRQPRA